MFTFAGHVIVSPFIHLRAEEEEEREEEEEEEEEEKEEEENAGKKDTKEKMDKKAFERHQMTVLSSKNADLISLVASLGMLMG